VTDCGTSSSGVVVFVPAITAASAGTPDTVTDSCTPAIWSTNRADWVPPARASIRRDASRKPSKATTMV